ncbi:vegetative cell wall protein gp1-like [Schistocerca americana]|uniref:vegetative cell wall protein gp1-like n=1 Tax=Schistocerca americana TaxID=7009 RepID=UPI001F501252|nr:vegetative cell wall protein gp1-like [Schistocerca americana]
MDQSALYCALADNEAAAGSGGANVRNDSQALAYVAGYILQKMGVTPETNCSAYLVRGGFQPRLPTSLPPPGQQQQPSPLPRRQPVPLMPPAQLHPGAPQVVAPAPAVPLQSPPPSELMDVDPSAGPPSQAVAVQPVLQPLSLGSPKESDTAAPCPAPTQQQSTQRQETLPLFVGPDAPSRPVPEAAPVVTGLPPRPDNGGGGGVGAAVPGRLATASGRQEPQ